ncbi:hypothetical protein [Streptomyces sp. NPDC058861]
MAATTAYREHADACAACTITDPGPDCQAGARLYESFSSLQAAYLHQQ